MTPFEYVGVWWLPDQSMEAGCHGTLRFDGTNNPTLEILGTLRPLRGIGSNPFRTDIILGFTHNGNRVTLYDCVETHTGLSFPGIPTITYIATYAIVGSHLPAKEQVRFDKFWIRYDRLAEWSQLTGFTEKLDWDRNALRRIGVRWQAPAPYETTVEGWRVRFAHWINQKGDRVEQYNLEHQTRLELTPPEPKSLEEFHGGFANHYRNFVTLGVGTAIYTTTLEATAVISTEESQVEKRNTPTRPSRIYQHISRRGKPSGKIEEFKMLFSLPTLGRSYARCLRRWYSRAELLRPVYNLYFGTLYSEPGYVETEFLLLAQALESYHSRAFARKATFAKRILEVVKRLGRAAQLLIADPAGFARRVTDTRNYLTHWDEKLRKRAAAGEDLWLLAQQARFVLELCFLREMGLSAKRIYAIASKHEQYLFLRSRLKL